jgi:hypothetical protein
MNIQLFAYDSRDLQRLLTTNRCPGGDLSNADLSGKDLKGANLRKANLNTTNLTGANLKNADLKGAILSNANLQGVNLKSADLKHANFHNANLNEADLRHADLKFAFLGHATLVNADLRRANLSFANLQDADLSGVNLEGAITHHTIFPKPTPVRTPSATPGLRSPTPRRTVTPTKNPPPLTIRPTATIRPTPTPTPVITPEPTPTLIPEQGMASGRVLDMFTGQGLEGALIDVYNGPNFSNYITTSTCGMFGIYNLPLEPGQYRILVRTNFYLPFSAYTQITQGAVTYDPPLIAVPSTDSGITAITGKTVNIANGNPISGSMISLRAGINAHDGPVVATATTDINGEYSVNVPAGNYTGEITGSNYISDYTNMVSANNQTKPVKISQTNVLSGNQMRIALTWNNSTMNDQLCFCLDGHDLNNNPVRIYPYIWEEYSDIFKQEGSVDFSYGPQSVIIRDISQLKNGVYSVYYTKQNSTGSMVLAFSQAQVKVYEGANLVVSYNVPVNQAGNLWTVFAIDQNGITPINQISDETNPRNIQAHEFNGDGRADWYQTSPNSLTVFHFDGKNSYDINASQWKIVGFTDTDGEAGEEIIVQTYTVDGNEYLVPDRVLIIYDRTQTIKEITGFYSPGNGGSVTTVFGDLDGEPGNELLLEKYDDDLGYIVRIISDRTNTFHDYNMYGVNVFSSTPQKTGELNGLPGNELIYVNNDRTGIVVLDFLNNQIDSYPIDYRDWNTWDIHLMNQDGNPGNEIIITPINSVEYSTTIIYERTRSKEKLTGVLYTYDGNYDLDGEPGRESIWGIFTESPYQYIIRIISGSDESYRDYDASGFSRDSFMEAYTETFSGQPGVELLIRDYSLGNFGVISYQNNTIHTYTIPCNYSWSLFSFVNTDGEPGLEIVVEAVNSSNGITNKNLMIIHDRTQTINQYPDLGTLDEGFHLNAFADVNNEPGLELIYAKSVFDPFQYFIRVICDRTNSYRDYDLSNLGPGFYLDSYNITDLNGRPGNELILTRYLDDGSCEYAIFDYSNEQIHHYTIEAGWWVHNVYDYDGQPGNEIVLTNGQAFKAICDTRGIIIE